MGETKAGEELPAGSTGVVYFESDVVFAYHRDPDKTRAATHPTQDRWRTFGDIGRLDADGYLTLTDRVAFTIVSGGVNIYPQEVENLLSSHPAVADVAVFGVPDEDFGETVKAVVEPMPGTAPGAALADELSCWCRSRMAHYKCPRSIDFVATLPRLDTGKLAKSALRDSYRARRS